jgi:hypothetical protein
VLAGTQSGPESLSGVGVYAPRQVVRVVAGEFNAAVGRRRMPSRLIGNDGIRVISLASPAGSEKYSLVN